MNTQGKTQYKDDPLLDDAQRLRLVEENVKDYAIFTVHPDGHIATWNVGAERIFGYCPEEIIGQTCATLFTPEDRARHADAEERRIAAETGRTEDERWHIRKDNSRFWASGIMTALRDRQGQMRGYVKIVRDFTERKQHQDRIEGLNYQLQQAMMEAHHRIKNNLQVVAALVDLKMPAEGDTVSVSDMKRVEQHIRALAAIHELLTERVVNDPKADTISAKAILETLLGLIQKVIHDRHLTFQLEEVEISMKQGTSLAIVVNELVSNAVKHSTSDIDITFHVTGNRAELAVCDEGPGFPEGFQPKLEAHTGLELVERIARWDMQGDVTYENRKTGGARVIVGFPLSTRS
jgi:PAS domain S-box-containing protein